MFVFSSTPLALRYDVECSVIENGVVSQLPRVAFRSSVPGPSRFALRPGSLPPPSRYQTSISSDARTAIMSLTASYTLVGTCFCRERPLQIAKGSVRRPASPKTLIDLPCSKLWSRIHFVNLREACTECVRDNFHASETFLSMNMHASHLYSLDTREEGGSSIYHNSLDFGEESSEISKRGKERP